MAEPLATLEQERSSLLRQIPPWVTFAAAPLPVPEVVAVIATVTVTVLTIPATLRIRALDRHQEHRRPPGFCRREVGQLAQAR